MNFEGTGEKRMCSTISKTAQIAPTATVLDGVIIGENVVIGDGVWIDHGCIIRDNVRIGNNSRIGARCILGEYLQDFYRELHNGEHPLVIGENALIRSETIIYGDTTIGASFQSGHRVTIREHTRIGDHVSVGTLSDIQGYCTLEDYVHMHSNVHVGQQSIVHRFAWLFPYVVLTNDPQPPSMKMLGVEIGPFAVVSTGTVVLPGVHIGQDALVGAASVVTKDVPMETVVFGNPAKPHGSVRDIKDDEGQSTYPWRFHFERGMPWEGIGYETWKEQN